MNLPRPPIAVLSTKAEVLYDALYTLPTIKKHADFETFDLGEARWPIAHWDRDGASSNNRLLAAKMSMLGTNVLCSDRVCGNHSTNLVEGSVAAIIDQNYINRMYSLALLLRMHGYFARLILSVSIAVQAAKIIKVFLPAAAAAYGKELKDYHIRNYKKVMFRRRREQVDWDSSLDGGDGDGEPREPGLGCAGRSGPGAISLL